MISSPLPQLRSPWLFFARSVWIVIVAFLALMLVVTLAQFAINWWNFVPSPEACLTQENYKVCMGDIEVNQRLGVTNHFWAVYYTLWASLEMVPFLLVGILIFWRRSNFLFELLFSLWLVLYGVLGVDGVVSGMISILYPRFYPVVPLLTMIGLMLVILWYRFPNGRFVPGVFRWLAGLWILRVLFAYLFPNTMLNVDTWPEPLPRIIGNLMILTIIGSLVYRFRYDSNPIERQQIKWVVYFGVFHGLVLIGSDYVFEALHTPDYPDIIYNLTYRPLSYLSSALLAISLGISILRYRLWDIDVIIRRTLIYSLLTGTLTLIYLALVIVSQVIFPAGSQVAIIASTLVVAGLFTPLRRQIQRIIDHRFYRNKYNAEKALATFSTSLKEIVDPDELIDLLANVVDETIHPESISFWLKPVPGEKKLYRFNSNRLEVDESNNNNEML